MIVKQALESSATIWNRSTTIGLAKCNCHFCHGYGMRPKLHYPGCELPCSCVFRSIFRIVMKQVHYCLAMYNWVSIPNPSRQHKPYSYKFGNQRIEYLADVWLTSKRCLSELDFQIFVQHYWRRLPWEMCCETFGMRKDKFYRTTYLIAEKLGRKFAEIEPYPIYPVYRYFRD